MIAADPAGIAATLSGPMRRALAAAQEDLFADRAVVTGHGMTIKALRTRRIVTRERPALLTAFGRAVIAGIRSSPAKAGEKSPPEGRQTMTSANPRERWGTHDPTGVMPTVAAPRRSSHLPDLTTSQGTTS